MKIAFKKNIVKIRLFVRHLPTLSQIEKRNKLYQLL